MQTKIQNIIQSPIFLKSVVISIIIIGIGFIFLDVLENFLQVQISFGEKIIITFLGLLNVTERFRTLSNIEGKIDTLNTDHNTRHSTIEAKIDSLNTDQHVRHGTIERKIDTLIKERDILYPRVGQSDMKNFIERAHKAIWISGIALPVIAEMEAILKRKADAGVTINLLMISNDPMVMEETGRYLGEKIAYVQSKLEGSRTKLERVATQHPNQVTIGTLNHRPAMGYFIIDPDDDMHGYMAAGFYLYKRSGQECPMLILSKKTDPTWFNIYRSDFEQIWDGADKWQPTPSKS